MSDDRVGKEESAQGRRWKEKRCGTPTAGSPALSLLSIIPASASAFVRRFLSFVSLHALLLSGPAGWVAAARMLLVFICILRGPSRSTLARYTSMITACMLVCQATLACGWSYGAQEGETITGWSSSGSKKARAEQHHFCVIMRAIDFTPLYLFSPTLLLSLVQWINVQYSSTEECRDCSTRITK
jgi:hypothetical protein